MNNTDIRYDTGKRAGRKKVPVLFFDGLPMVCGECSALIGRNPKISYCPFCGTPVDVYTDGEEYERAKKNY